MEIIKHIQRQAKSLQKRIVLPEGEEPRIIQAAAKLYEDNLVKPVLLGNVEKIRSHAADLQQNLGDTEIISPAESDLLSQFANEFYEIRKHKGMTEEAAAQSVKDPLYFGAFLLKNGLADGAVAGSINTTGNVLRAAIQVVGLAENVSVVSSSFLMVLRDGKLLTFADCAVIPDPDPDQLASIAISSAETHQRLAGETPQVAMLSFSTKGSADHPDVEKVVSATATVKKLAPSLIVDGELQFDAAYLESVGSKKAPGSPVAGKANVFIFPDLNSGNIGYKLTQRLAGAEAIGPVIQGLHHPYNDLSRGCSVDDVVNVACICAMLA